MFGRLLAALVAVLLAVLPTLAFAREGRIQRVVFRDGHAVVKGRIKGYQYVDYVFPVGSGESLKVSLPADKSANYFNLLAPDETEVAFFVGATSGDHYEGVAPTSGDYRARVYLMRRDARRGAVVNYTLRIAVGQTSATNEKGPDYADGLTGGPDFWEVTGVVEGDALSLRGAPSPRGRLIARLPNTTVLCNLGCKNTSGQRWCRVEQPKAPAMRGWVNGRYLRESGGPK
jgi:hypothetical protein